MRSIVINLPEDTERLKAFQEVYPSDIFGELEVWKAKSGKEVEVPSWWQRSANRYALTVNIRDILDAVDEDVWIWEDDCTFSTDNFKARYTQFMSEVPDDADMVFLGAFHFVPPTRISEHCLKMKAAWTSHSILYKKKCLKEFSDYFKEPNWGCKHFSDQRRAQGIYTGKFTAYSPLQGLCGQAEGYSTLDLHERPPRWYNKFRFIDFDGKLKWVLNGEIQSQHE